MGVELLGAPQQAFLTLAGAVSHTGEVGAAMTTVGANLGFDRCQVGAVPATPAASIQAAWLHRGTAQAFGDFGCFPLRMRMTVAPVAAAARPRMLAEVTLVTPTHFAAYRSAENPADEFVFVSAGTLAAGDQPQVDNEEIIKKLNTTVDDMQWGEIASGTNVRAKNCLWHMRIEFVWQFVEKFPTERDFDKINIRSLGSKTRNHMKEALKKSGLWFGMQFPAEFVKRQPESR